MSEQQQFMPIKSPYALSVSELDRLRERVRTAEESAAKETDWTSRVRAEQNAKSFQRELESAELESKLAEQRSSRVPDQQQQRQQQEGGPAAGHYVVSDGGGAYLYVQNAAPARREPSRQQQQFMPIVATDTNKSGEAWPESFNERHGLLKAAIAQLRQAGVA